MQVENSRLIRRLSEEIIITKRKGEISTLAVVAITSPLTNSGNSNKLR